MSKFLTVKEAAQIIGKSPSAVRRIIYPILKDDNNPDRKHIEPSIEDALNLRLKGDNFAWRISEEYLRRVAPASETQKRDAARSATPADGEASASVIAILQQELSIKNEQIAAQNQIMQGLSERLREGNILIGSLQRQLALTDGRSRDEKAVVDAEPTNDTEKRNKPPVKSAKPEKGSSVPPKPAKPKGGFFSRLFR